MKKIKALLIYMVSVHVLALAFMSLQRMVLLISNWQQVADTAHKGGLLVSAFVRGLWFDNVIACYITGILMMILPVFGLLNRTGKVFFRVTNVLYTVLYSLVFAVGVSDIPYFSYFFKHLNSSIFAWTEERGTAMGMILEEKSYYVYFVFFVVNVALFAYILTLLTRKLRGASTQGKNAGGKHSRYFQGGHRGTEAAHTLINMKGVRDYAIYIPLVLVLIGLGIFGARGRVGYNPIKTSQAYFCDNTFINELGLNPLFFFINDIIDAHEKHFSVDNLVTEKAALNFARKSVGLSGSYVKYPLKREITVASDSARKLNVVVILMESMSANLLDVEEQGKTITPYLHSLISKSYYFPNFYSAGNHTNHGVMATLFGLPALFGRNMMKNVNIPLTQGLPYTLGEQGYRTLFFMPHESQYDNMNAFLRENGVQEIYSQANYPVADRVNSFGVPDGFLFDYALKKLNNISHSSQPFQATILTISNHPPYIVPEAFKKISRDPKYQIVAYADHCIGTFMEQAAKQAWFPNTVFVFLGDHGKVLGTNSYEMPLSFNHIPLIIYSAALKDAPRKIKSFGGQVDVFPTVMGLLRTSYTNNTFGMDLLKHPRSYMYFSSDDGIGCINSRFFYAFNFKANSEGLYEYRNGDTKNYINSFRTLADSMKTATASMVRATEYVMNKDLMRITKP